MKQFDLQGNVYDCTIEMIPLKKATYEDIQALNINLQTQLLVKEEEIERLNNKVEELMTLYTTEREVKEDYKSIIKEAREYIKKSSYLTISGRREFNNTLIAEDLLNILDKGE